MKTVMTIFSLSSLTVKQRKINNTRKYCFKVQGNSSYIQNVYTAE